jgi:hypothetical protein
MYVSFVDEVIGPLPPPASSPPASFVFLYLLLHLSGLLDILLALLKNPACCRAEGPN